MSRLRHLGWNQCSHGLSSRPLESCHRQCLQTVCGVLVYPKGAAAELLDGTLNLRHCTTIFLPHVFPLGLYLGLGMGVVNGSLLLLVILLIQVVIWEKESGLPGRHVQVYLLMSFRILGIHRRGDGKDCANLPPKEWGVRWVSLANFFLDLGLGEFCTWGRLEPAFGGNRRRAFAGWTDQPKGPVHQHIFNSLRACA